MADTHPRPAIGRFAKLRVVAVQRIGAYLDWGHPEELFLPLRNQTEILAAGEEIVVFIYLDETERPLASMRLEEYIDHDTSRLFVSQRVSLLVLGETEQGYLALIDGQHIGVLYHSEVFQKLEYASQVTGYVKKIRQDGKVDLILQPLGITGSGDLGRQILDKLRGNGGFLPLTDQSTPETIYSLFGVSKKKYKMALGGIYKKKLVFIDPDGIRLRAD